MKVRINKTELSLATARAQGAISDKTLSQIALKAIGDKLHVSVADRVLVIYSSLVCEVMEAGELFIPARLFADVVRELPEGMVTLEKNNTSLCIIAGYNGEFVMKLPRIEEKTWREAPVIDSENFADIQSDKLLYMIEQIQFCVAHESPRNYGAVGYFHKPDQGKLRLVGTDGFRLSFAEMETELPELFLNEGVCISKRALNELQRMCGEGLEKIRIAISSDRTTLAATADDYQIYIRLSAVKYPNYEGVLPTSNLIQVEVSRPYLQSVAKRVLLAADKTRAIRLCFSDLLLTISSRTAGSSEGKESIVIKDYRGEDRTLTINGKFFTDVFSTVNGDKVTLNFKSEEDPVVIYPKKEQEPKDCRSLHVLVPIKESH